MRRASLLLLPGLLLAAAGALAGDLAAGRVQAEPCLACHGARVTTVDPKVPLLDGQRESYMLWQLVFFRNGRRVSLVMNDIAAGLSEEAMRNVSAWFAAQPPPPPPMIRPDPELHALGREVAARHGCGACHGATWRGSEAAPSIARQRRGYTAKALADYRSSNRPSVGLAAMSEAASRLTDAEIAALAAFLEDPG